MYMSLNSFFEKLFRRKSPTHHLMDNSIASTPKPLDLDTATAEEIDSWIIAFGREIRRVSFEISHWEQKAGATNPIVVQLRQKETELNIRRDLARAKLAELRSTK